MALAAGELVDEAILKFLQLHVGNGLVDDALILGGGATPGIGKAPKGDQLPDGELHLDAVGLGEDGQTLGKLLALPLGDVPTLKIHQAGVPGDEPGDDAHDGGLSRPVGADEGKHLPLGDLKGDGIHHGFAVVLFFQFFYLQPLDPPSCEQQIEEIHAAAHGDEHAYRDGIGVHMLHNQLARHQNHHPKEHRARDELGVAVGF